MKKKSRSLQTPIEPFTVEPGLSADAVLGRMERISFQGRNLATAHRIWHRMLKVSVQADATIALPLLVSALATTAPPILAKRTKPVFALNSRVMTIDGQNVPNDRFEEMNESAV